MIKITAKSILCPQMSPIHFGLVEAAFNTSGFRLEVLNTDDKAAVDMGLKYVNNDACFPSLIVVGQIMDAVHSGKYNLDKTAVLISQTGGGCRASNYIGFIRRALEKAGYPNIPVISINPRYRRTADERAGDAFLSGGRSGFAKQANRQAIIDHLYRHGPSTKQHLQMTLGLHYRNLPR